MTTSLRVLLVDDEPNILEGLRRSLPGFDVTTLTDPAAAVELVAVEHFDAVVSDYHMPGLNGVELLAEVAQHSPETAGLLLTGSLDMAVAVEALNAGCVARFLRKPLEAAVLGSVIEEVTASRRAFSSGLDSSQRRAIDLPSQALFDFCHTQTQQLLLSGFAIHYQPIFDLTTMQPSGAEALSRFESGTPPDRFSQARRAGLARELEHRAIELAIRRVDAFDSSCRLWLNVSHDHLDANLLRLIGPHCEQIQLEITENTEVSDYAALTRDLAPFRAAGALVAVDDAGAGFAGLRQIAALTPDAIKLDRSLITGIAGDPVRQRLIEALLGFANDVGSSLIAEGVETATDLAALGTLGVRQAQGFFLRRPAAWGAETLRRATCQADNREPVATSPVVKNLPRLAALEGTAPC